MPAKAIQLFHRRVQELTARHSELMLAVINKRNQASLETMLAEQLVMSCGILWEAFLHDLIIAYVLSSPSTALKSLKGRVSQSIADRYGGEVAKQTKFAFRGTMTRNKATALLDPRGFNITATSSVELAKVTNQLLEPQHAKRFALSAQDAQFVDFMVALRNYLAHRSVGSREALRTAVTQMNAPGNAALTGAVGKVGPYLKHRDNTGRSRALIIAQRLHQVATFL